MNPIFDQPTTTMNEQELRLLQKELEAVYEMLRCADNGTVNVKYALGHSTASIKYNIIPKVNFALSNDGRRS